MRMQPCPHCGAQNSVKRTTCYQCQQPLDFATSGRGQGKRAEPADNARPEPASRWEAIQTEGTQPRGRADIGTEAPGGTAGVGSASSVEQQFPAFDGSPVRRYAPAPRSALKHVRMMGVFFRELHTLTRAGIAIAPACREVERRTPARLRVVAAEMAAATEAGSRISSVLENHPALIYPWHLGVIRAAEVGAFMPEAFDQIARAYETEWETRAALRLRMFFYLLVGLPAILTTLPVVLFLRQPIPDFDAWNTQYVIRGLLHQAETVSLPILAGVIALIVIWQLLGRWAWFQGAQQRVVVRLPLVGKVARGSALERYMGTLGLMLRGGVPIAQAAEEAALAAGNADMSPKLLDFVPRLREGATLSSLLAQSRFLDADSLSMAATGEIAGALPDMLARAAGYYRADLEARRRALLRLAGVAIGLLWAVCVGVVFITGALSYFDFIFRAGDKLWMESFE